MPRRSGILMAALLSMVVAVPGVANAGSSWIWPVHGPVVAGFKLAPDPFAAGQRRGIEIAPRSGSEVGSACRGRVLFAGLAGSNGLTVSVRCGGLRATYTKLAALSVHRGDRLAPGHVLGRSAATLHFGVRREGDRFGYLDPLGLLPRPARAPLGPAPAPRGLPRLPRAEPPAAGPDTAPMRLRSTEPVPREDVGARVPLIAWLGAALMAIGVPGAGLRLRRRRRRRHAGLARVPR